MPSKQLRVLESAGLVEHRSVGTRNLYALAPEGFTALQLWLVNTWDRALDAFAERMAEIDRERFADPAGARAEYDQGWPQVLRA
jgi:DNA-binding PadR family transcriptional regulator